MPQTKSETFDPYYKWLAIPPDQRPIHYYRLLGVDAFEASNDVILNAADQRMIMLRTFQAGQHKDAAARIMNEVAQAKVCLSDPDRRAAYDKGLKKLLAGSGVQQGVEATQVVPLDANDKGSASTAPAAAPATPKTPEPKLVVAQSARRGKARKPNRLGVQFAVLAVLIAAAAGLVYWMWVNSQDAVVLAPQVQPPVSPDSDADGGFGVTADGETVIAQPDGSAADVTTTTEPPSTTSGESSRPGDDTNAQAKPATDGDQPRQQPAAAEKTSTAPRKRKPKPPVKKRPTNNTPVQKPTPGNPRPQEPPPEEAPPEKDDRFDVPDVATRRAAEQKFEQTYKDDLKDLKLAEKKAAFAKGLVENLDVVRELPAELYVTLQVARKMAIDAGDVDHAVAVSELVAKHFKSSRLSEREATLRDLAASRGVVSTKVKIQLAAHALEAARMAVVADDLELATEMADLANRAAVASRYDELLQQTVALKKEVGLLRRSFAGLEKALSQAGQDGADPGFDSTAGRWLCFVRGEWEQGLPLLAAGDEEDLAQLSKRDLEQDGDPQQQIEAADGWWELAADEEGIVKDGLHARALHWYAEARPHVRGLASQRVEVRIKEIGEQPASLLCKLIDGDLEHAVASGSDVAESQSAASGPQRLLPRGQWIDALALFPPDADLGEKAKLAGSKLQLINRGAMAALPIVVDAGTSYEVAAEFSIARMSPRPGGVGLVIPVGAKRCIAWLTDKRNMTPSALVQIDGKWKEGNPTATAGVLAKSKRYRLGVQVLVEADQCQVAVTLDGQPHFRWAGSPEALSPPAKFAIPKDPRRLAARANESRVVFHAIRFRLVLGNAAAIAVASRPAAESPK